MNYQWHYDQLVHTRKTRIIENGIYCESHHILPKSMGGDNSPENLILLTAREHFIAHWLLWRIYRNRQTACAFHSMCIWKNNYTVSARIYEEARIAHNLSISGENNGRYNGNGTTDETRAKIRNSKLGKPMSDEFKKGASFRAKGEKNCMYNTSVYKIWVEKYGKEIADQKNILYKEKISLGTKGIPKTDGCKAKMSEKKLGKNNMTTEQRSIAARKAAETRRNNIANKKLNR